MPILCSRGAVLRSQLPSSMFILINHAAHDYSKVLEHQFEGGLRLSTSIPNHCIPKQFTKGSGYAT